MGVLEYLPHLLYSTALTSISMHHLYQRKAAAEERSHVAAQISILEDLRARLSAREPIPEREVERLWHLARSHDVWAARAEAEAAARAGDTASTGAGMNVKSVHMQARPGEEIGWREVLLGRRFDSRRTEELDRKDLESGESPVAGFCALLRHGAPTIFTARGGADTFLGAQWRGRSRRVWAGSRGSRSSRQFHLPSVLYAVHQHPDGLPMEGPFAFSDNVRANTRSGDDWGMQEFRTCVRDGVGTVLPSFLLSLLAARCSRFIRSHALNLAGYHLPSSKPHASCRKLPLRCIYAVLPSIFPRPSRHPEPQIQTSPP